MDRRVLLEPVCDLVLVGPRMLPDRGELKPSGHLARPQVWSMEVVGLMMHQDGAWIRARARSDGSSGSPARDGRARCRRAPRAARRAGRALSGRRRGSSRARSASRGEHRPLRRFSRCPPPRRSGSARRGPPRRMEGWAIAHLLRRSPSFDPAPVRRRCRRLTSPAQMTSKRAGP